MFKCSLERYSGKIKEFFFGEIRWIKVICKYKEISMKKKEYICLERKSEKQGFKLNTL